MNYKRIYDQLIQKRIKQPSTQQYVERHHIVPKSIDPSKANDKNNIVVLSAREHFIAHALLVKITKNSENKADYYKMLCAFDVMSVPNNKNKKYRSALLIHRYNSILYQHIRVQIANYRKETGCRYGENNPNYNKKIIHNLQTNKIKFINKDLQIPEGWQRGFPECKKKKGEKSNSYGKRWIYNKKTLKQRYIKEDIQLPKGWTYGLSPIHRQKLKKSYSAPSKDKIWISNLELKETKLVDKDQQLEQGWLYGRILDFDLYLQKYNDALNQKKKWSFINYQKSIKEHKVITIIDKSQRLKK